MNNTISLTILLFFYNVLIYVGNIIISIGSLFKPQWKEMLIGRRTTLKWLNDWQRPDSDNIVWMHCASLGEFEQGRPLIELIKEKNPDSYILLSFFSPSGYNQMKDYPIADHVFYLPSDTRSNARKLSKKIAPSIFINVKYEFWWNLLDILTQSKTCVFHISAVFRETDYFFYRLLSPLKTILSRIDNIFVQDNLSIEVIKSQNITSKISVAGDTRVDRVVFRAKLDNTPSLIASKLINPYTIIYGSVWDSDMFIVKDCIGALPQYTHVIVPHDVSIDNVRTIQNQINSSALLFSQLDSHALSKIYIIDKIGLLSGLYKYGRFAYIGGGFQRGIHNTLEPAAYGIPVFFGPNHKKFVEAVTMNELGLCFSIDNANSMISKIQLLDSSSDAYKLQSDEIKSFIDQSSMATQKIYSIIYL